MEVLDRRVEQKREIFDFYSKELANIGEINFMPEIKNSRGNRWLTTLTFDKTNPKKVIDALEEHNIESRPLWKPMHLQPLFKGCSKSFIDGTSEELYKKGICLPSPTKDFNKLYRVVEVIENIC